MSRYIETITKANKTLTKKNEDLIAENAQLKKQIVLLKREVNCLTQRNSIRNRQPETIESQYMIEIFRQMAAVDLSREEEGLK